MGQAISLKIQKPNTQVSDLDSLTLTMEQVEELRLDKAQIFEVAAGENILGLIPQSELKLFLEQNPDQYANTFVRKIGQEVWMPSTQHAFLQRRKPTLVKDNEISANERFFFSKEGQKMGPFTLEELRAKVEKREILVTEMIIPEKGGNWFKLFELGSFDRRLPSQVPNHLPERPAAHIFEQESKSKNKDRFEERDAMAGLAYIGQIKSGKITELQDQAPKEEASEFEEDTAVRLIKRQRLYKRLMSVSMVLITTIALGWFFVFKWNAPQTFETKVSAPSQDAPTLTPISIISGKQGPAQLNRIKRSPASAIRPISTIRRPTSTTIKNSDAYRQQQDQFLNYDQGQNPVENDPVREQLSPETLNPQSVEGTESQNWASPENLQPNNPGENPFDGEVSN